MGAPLALLICSIGVGGLFSLNRDKSVQNSKALWLPVIWLWIVGSRPVSAWLGIGGGSGGSLASTLDGSPLDAAVFGILVLAGIAVLFSRKRKTSALLAVSGPIVIYFLYCLISVTWSPIHGPAFKRWIKAIGDLVMVLIVLTDGQPVAALRRLYSRVGFILFPFSIALIRYTDLGRGYTPDGAPENTGVTTNKNSLGLIVFIISLGALWNLRALLKDKQAPNRTRRLVAQITLIAFGMALLQMSHSATSGACFILGGGLMLMTSLQAIRKRPSRVAALCLAVVLAGGLGMLFGGGSALSESLGRGEGLSGRTEIWAASIAAADNPIIGTGFESFWNTNVDKVARGLQGYWDIHNLVSAHNGYIEVYLDLGWIGVALIVLILFTGYRRAIKAFQYNPELASLTVAYITTATFYSVTEAGFRVLSPSWIFLLLAVVSASGVATGLVGEPPENLISRGGFASRTSTRNKFIADGETVYTIRRGMNQFGMVRANDIG
ncbi:MAG: O-antigen ligase family protein [Candidatus Acidiferrales bacterium]